jgi:hypothetical protein
MNHKWYEVWADEGHEIPYVLILVPSGSNYRLGASSGDDDGYAIFDPKENDRRVFIGSTYEEAKLWLLEDEFTLVARKYIED